MSDFVVDCVFLFCFCQILFIEFCISIIICFERASGGPVLKYIGWSECTDAGLTGKWPGCSLQFLMGYNILCNDVFSFPWYAICFERASCGPVLKYIGWSECTDVGLTGKLPGCYCSLLIGFDILCNDVICFPFFAIRFEHASGGPVLKYIGCAECTDDGLTGKLPCCSLQFVDGCDFSLQKNDFFWFNFAKNLFSLHFVELFSVSRYFLFTFWVFCCNMQGYKLFIAFCWWV